MSLIDIPDDELKEKSVEDIVKLISLAEENQLSDGSSCSNKFRKFLSEKVDTIDLEKYATQCLNNVFKEKNQGEILQDVVNEIGRRLGFQVENGRYRGAQDQSNYDGLWELNDGYKLLVEVKKTDAYAMKLNNLENYRQNLISKGELSFEQSGMLIIVGREDTDSLGNQIRGSEYAWDIRYISIPALLNLLKIKVNATDDPKFMEKITNILIPRQYTKLDGIVDLVFSTAESIENERYSMEEEETPAGSKSDDLIPKIGYMKLQEECIEKIQNHLNKQFIKISRTHYKDTKKEINLICLTSKLYRTSKFNHYWYAFREHHKEALSDSKVGYIALCCGSIKNIILIPSDHFLPWTENMSASDIEERGCYRHVRVNEENGKYNLHLKGKKNRIDLTQYKI